jgi:hypothetical protein
MKPLSTRTAFSPGPPVSPSGAAKENTPRPMSTEMIALPGESAGSSKPFFSPSAEASAASFFGPPLAGAGAARLTETTSEYMPQRISAGTRSLKAHPGIVSITGCMARAV